MTGYVIAANRLTDGRVVFWTENQAWSEEVAQSWLIPETERESQLSRAAQDHTTAVAAALVELSDSAARLPLRARERILFHGPSIPVPLDSLPRIVP